MFRNMYEFPVSRSNAYLPAMSLCKSHSQLSATPLAENDLRQASVGHGFRVSDARNKSALRFTSVGKLPVQCTTHFGSTRPNPPMLVCDPIRCPKASPRLKAVRGCLTEYRQGLEFPSSGTRRLPRTPVHVSGTLNVEHLSRFDGKLVRLRTPAGRCRSLTKKGEQWKYSQAAVSGFAVY